MVRSWILFPRKAVVASQTQGLVDYSVTNFERLKSRLIEAFYLRAGPKLTIGLVIKMHIEKPMEIVSKQIIMLSHHYKWRWNFLYEHDRLHRKFGNHYNGRKRFNYSLK